MGRLKSRKVLSVVLALILFMQLGAIEILSNSVLADDPVVAFPDANLELVIRQEIRKPVGDIRASDLVGLTILQANNMGITDLTGIEYCANLTWLSLNSNQISNLTPLTRFTNLTWLSLNSNQISNLTPLAGLNNLSSLSLGYNLISDLVPLTGLIKLTGLGLQHNQISNLTPLAGLSNLTNLSLGLNQIRDLVPLVGLTNLTNLSLNENEISDLTPLANLTKMELLWLDNNQISNIAPLAGLINLIWLILSNNRINSITPLANITNLVLLDIPGNQITDVASLVSLSKLVMLNASYNQITDVTSLARIITLRELGLGVNRITNLMPLVNLTNITNLGLDRNLISDIAPLVANIGLGNGDAIGLTNNPLSQTSINVYIPTLLSRGVTVSRDGTSAIVITNTATYIANNSATLNGSLTSLGTAAYGDVSFQYGISSGNYNNTPAIRMTAPGNFSYTVTGLTPGTTNYYRARAIANGVPVYGAPLTFVYADPPPPPSLPQTFYGSVTVGVSPATPGSAIIAKVGNTQVGSTATDSQGRYGYTTIFPVTATTGSTIDFYVNGVKADQSIQCVPSSMTNLNLTVSQCSRFDIYLERGWNLISIPSSSQPLSPDTLFSSCPGNIVSAWAYQPGGSWQSWAPGAPSSINTITSCKAYWVNALNACIISVCCPIIIETMEVKTYLRDCGCSQGWVAMGLPRGGSYTAGEYLRGVNYSILYTFRQGAWAIVQPTDTLVLGKGYFIYINSCTADTAPPIITDVNVSNIFSSSTGCSAEITWKTDEPATSQVSYGTSASYGTLQPPQTDTTPAIFHDVILYGLAPRTTFHYKVTSRDTNGNERSSPDATFVTPAPAGSSVGDSAPDFTLACIDGSQVTLSALRGKKIIINFWNLQCHYSMEEMPYFKEVRSKYPDSSVAMLIINSAAGGFSANRREAVGEAVTSGGYTFTVPLDEAGSVAQAYNVTNGIPVTFFVDSTGIIKSKQDGSFPSTAAIEVRLNSY